MLFSKPFEQRGFILPEGLCVKGDIEASVWGRIDGVVEGGVVMSEKLVVGPRAVVFGNIKADTIIVEGKVNGDVVCEKNAVIAGTAHISGMVVCKTITVADGAFIGGDIKSTNNPKWAAPANKHPQKAINGKVNGNHGPIKKTDLGIETEQKPTKQDSENQLPNDKWF